MSGLREATTFVAKATVAQIVDTRTQWNEMNYGFSKGGDGVLKWSALPAC